MKQRTAFLNLPIDPLMEAAVRQIWFAVREDRMDLLPKDWADASARRRNRMISDALASSIGGWIALVDQLRARLGDPMIPGPDTPSSRGGRRPA